MAKNHFLRSNFGSQGILLGFWGLFCIEKWSQNFDPGTGNAISGTPKMVKKKGNFGGTENGIFQYKLAPKTPN